MKVYTRKITTIEWLELYAKTINDKLETWNDMLCYSDSEEWFKEVLVRWKNIKEYTLIDVKPLNYYSPPFIY